MQTSAAGVASSHDAKLFHEKTVPSTSGAEEIPTSTQHLKTTSEVAIEKTGYKRKAEYDPIQRWRSWTSFGGRSKFRKYEIWLLCLSQFQALSFLPGNPLPSS